MQVVFRADASRYIGSGHIMRCLTLADALHERGAACLFVCREDEGHMIDLIAERGHTINILPKLKRDISSTGTDSLNATLLSGDWLFDAQQVKQLLRCKKFDWLIVDHYALDYRWELAMRNVCHRIMVIDDLANRRHNCNLLLDQNYGSFAERYKDLIPVGCIQIHGPKFALLKSIYAKSREVQKILSGKIERVLIFFGSGEDYENLTGMALQAFQAPGLTEIELEIVVGFSYLHKEKLEVMADIRGKTRIHTQLPDLSELMIKSDLAIGAGGATTWERCCLGLPSIVISTADNQLPACQALSAEGIIEYLGHINDVVTKTLINAILNLLNSPDKLNLYRKACRQLVDGRGVDRVIKYLCDENIEVST